jgi:hypothetical protein
MWRRYFKFKLVPGIVITRQFGRMDFRNENLKISDLQRLYEEDFPYLELTPEGKRELYGIGEPVPEYLPELPVQKAIKKRSHSRLL